MIKETVLTGFIHGEKGAFDTLYAAYAPGMYGICLRYTRCKDDAKDVLQESFIKIYEARNKYNPEFPIGAWIKTITIRTAINYIRQQYRFQLTDDESKFDGPMNDPIEQDDQATLKKHLLNILQQLPDGYRTVFNLYTIDNLTHKEIAEYMGISEGTSKSQYSKAKKMIHSILETVKVEL